MESLTGLDAAFLSFETPKTPLQVGAVMVFEPPGKQFLFSDTARFGFHKRLIEQRLHLAPPLRRRALEVPFGIGHAVWIEDPDLDLDSHVRRTRLPTPGGPEELNEVVADLLSRQLDRSRPLWEMAMVEGLDGGRNALVAKLHHAILDGVSGASLMASFLDLGPRPREVESPAEEWTPEPVPSAVSLMKKAVTAAVREPGIAAGAIQQSIRILAGLSEQKKRLTSAGETPAPAPFTAPYTSLNGSLSSLRKFATATLSLDEIKLVGRAFGATVNDVVLTLVGGSLRALLENRGEDLDDPLVAMVPVSTRARSGRSSEQDDPANLGNRVSAMLVSLATTVDDPVERLNAVSKSSKASKRRTTVLGPRIVDDLAQLFPPAVSTRAAKLLSNLRLFDKMPPIFNVTVSNVPGPDFDLWFGGCRIEALYPIGPLMEGVGLNITAMSYVGNLHVGMLGCKKLVPDLETLPGLMEDCLGELLEEVPESVREAG